MKPILLIILLTLTVAPTLPARTSIMGDTEASVERMYQFVRAHNPDFDRDIAEAFHRIGTRYGIRADIALCQAILETGWFRFAGSTAVGGHQFNYCGLGVLASGMEGCCFTSMEAGVTAQFQHLYAYATKDPLPPGETLVDPRFGQVQRGIAPHWEKLNGRWAANKQYSKRILELYHRMLDFNVAEVINVGLPDNLFDSISY